mmetsp:Transcript_36380/g.109191  ORF Transcript_36380/g.109191 Transcript_36380/m.109191 type:complete len:203 (-) Transcript_36380:588-1196(-)
MFASALRPDGAAAAALAAAFSSASSSPTAMSNVLHSLTSCRSTQVRLEKGGRCNSGTDPSLPSPLPSHFAAPPPPPPSPLPPPPPAAPCPAAHVPSHNISPYPSSMTSDDASILYPAALFPRSVARLYDDDGTPSAAARGEPRLPSPKFPSALLPPRVFLPIPIIPPPPFLAAEPPAPVEIERPPYPPPAQPENPNPPGPPE